MAAADANGLSNRIDGLGSSGKEAVDLAEQVAELKTGARRGRFDNRTYHCRPSVPQSRRGLDRSDVQVLNAQIAAASAG